MKSAIYRAVDGAEDPAREFVAIIERGEHLRTFTYGSSYAEANTKAGAFISKLEARARPAPKAKAVPIPAAEEIEEAI